MALTATITNANFKGDNLSINMFGAKPDLVFLADGTTITSTTFHSPSAKFLASDVGKSIWIEDLSGSSDFLTTIAARVSTTTVTLTSPCPFSAGPVNFRYFTDNTVAIQAAFDWGALKGVRIYIPRGKYGISSSVNLNNQLTVVGMGGSTSNNVLIYPSVIVCCADVPAFQFTGTPFPTDFIDTFACEKLTFVGTSRTGSQGIYLNASFGTVLRDVSFYYFGDQGLLMTSGESGLLHNINTQSCCLVHTGRTDFVGTVQCGASDMEWDGVVATSSESYGPDGTFNTGAYGSGFIAGIAVQGGNAFVHDCQGHGSEIGFYIGGPVANQAQSSVTTLVNCRADQNQGEGFVITGFSNHFVGCRSYTNALSATATYDAFKIGGGGNMFTACQVIGPAGPFTNQYLNAFETVNDSPNESSYFRFNYIANGSWTGGDYVFTGTQTNNPVIDDTNLDAVTGSFAQRVRADFIVRDHNLWIENGLSLIRDTTAGTNAKIWETRVNAPTNPNQLLYAVLSDTGSVETTYLRVTRSGTSVTLVELIGTNILVEGTLQINNGNVIELLGIASIITCGAGDPDGVVTANQGSIYLDSNGSLWYKKTGSGNTGWFNLGSIPPFGTLITGDLLEWNGSEVVSWTGGFTGSFMSIGSITTGSDTFVTSVVPSFDPSTGDVNGITVSTGSINFVQSITTVTHTVNQGLVMT